MPFDSTEMKLDTNASHTNENTTIDATHQTKHRESREAELRDAFRKADFSERAGTPAERLEIMSKAANDLTLERAEAAAAKQKEDDAGFWESERSKISESAPSEKDTAIKPAPIAVEQQKKEESMPKEADSKPMDKIESKSESKPASPKSPKAKELKRTHDDDDDDAQWSDHGLPSERRSKLDRRVEERIPSDLAGQAEGEHMQNVAKEKAQPARQLDWTPAGEEKHLNKQLAKRKQWQAKHGREIDDPDNHTNTGARPTLREELAHHSARIWGTADDSNKEIEHRIPTATHVPATLELHSKQLDRRALRGDDDAIIKQKQSIAAPSLSGKLSEAKSTIGAKLSDAKEMVEDKLEAAEDKLAHWKDEAVEKMGQAKGKAIELKDDAVSKAAELRDDASAKATEIKRDTISKKDEISRDMDIKRKEISRDIDSKRTEISRDIDSKRSELRGKADSIDRDIRSRSSELKADAKDATSTIRSQAHTISEDVKAEVREDIAAVKAKMNELGRSITHKKDELKSDIQQRDITHHREIDLSNRRSGAIVDEKPAGLMDKVSSWWSGNKQQHETTLATGATGTLFPAHRWSRDPDAKDMQAKLDELRTAEGAQRTAMRGHDSTFAGGVRSQLSQGWQHIKTDLKPSAGKKDIEEHDWVEQADKASAFDIDNAPSSPRSWASSPSPRSPASPIQRSASPVSYRARSASPVAVQQGGGFFGGFDPTVMDACVEPW